MQGTLTVKGTYTAVYVIQLFEPTETTAEKEQRVATVPIELKIDLPNIGSCSQTAQSRSCCCMRSKHMDK